MRATWPVHPFAPDFIHWHKCRCCVLTSCIYYAWNYTSCFVLVWDSVLYIKVIAVSVRLRTGAEGNEVMRGRRRARNWLLSWSRMRIHRPCHMLWHISANGWPTVRILTDSSLCLFAQLKASRTARLEVRNLTAAFWVRWTLSRSTSAQASCLAVTLQGNCTYRLL